MGRWWPAVLVLLVLATGADAQRKGKGKGKVPAKAKAGGSELSSGYLPGFDEQEKNAKKTAPVGPRPKPKATPKAEPPPDPMKEADQVTAAADHLSEVERARLQFLREHFRICDLDSSGWLSLREVEVTLSFGRGEYRRMDGNQDGRLDETEFTVQGELLLARLGATPASLEAGRAAKSGEEAEELAEPRAEGGAAEAATEPAPEEPSRAEPDDEAAPPIPSEQGSMAVRPDDLLGRYDADLSAGIDAAEIEKLFLEAGLVLSPELVVAQMDPDDSGQLESGELVAIAWLVSQHVPEALRPAPAPEIVALADEPPPSAPGPLAEPPDRGALLPTHFARLDPGQDGFIDEADLRALQSPSRLDLRFRALLSAMDQDGDGRLSEAEFRGSMRGARR